MRQVATPVGEAVPAELVTTQEISTVPDPPGVKVMEAVPDPEVMLPPAMVQA